jgi:hypothetical protein
MKEKITYFSIVNHVIDPELSTHSIYKTFQSFSDDDKICFEYRSKIDIEQFIKEMRKVMEVYSKDGLINSFELVGSDGEYVVVKVYQKVLSWTDQISTNCINQIDYRIPKEYFSSMPVEIDEAYQNNIVNFGKKDKEEET